MKQLAVFAVAFAVGHTLITRVMPRLQAHLEALDLDTTWEIWNTEGWMR